jgi:hypothetical protein
MSSTLPRIANSLNSFSIPITSVLEIALPAFWRGAGSLGSFGLVWNVSRVPQAGDAI